MKKYRAKKKLPFMVLLCAVVSFFVVCPYLCQQAIASSPQHACCPEGNATANSQPPVHESSCQQDLNYVASDHSADGLFAKILSSPLSIVVAPYNPHLMQYRAYGYHPSSPLVLADKESLYLVKAAFLI